jgi:hypothetical protein
VPRCSGGFGFFPCLPSFLLCCWIPLLPSSLEINYPCARGGFPFSSYKW